MNTKPALLAGVALALALGMAVVPAVAQTSREQAEKELAQKMPTGSVPACSLISRADIKKATGREPYVDPEPAGQGGWICNVGIGELKVYTGPKSWEMWESSLKGFKKDKEPQLAAPGLGERATFLYPKPDSQHQGNVGILVVKSSNHTLALSLDAPDGKSAESTRPAPESLMKLILARLP